MISTNAGFCFGCVRATLDSGRISSIVNLNYFGMTWLIICVQCVLIHVFFVHTIRNTYDRQDEYQAFFKTVAPMENVMRDSQRVVIVYISMLFIVCCF